MTAGAYAAYRARAVSDSVATASPARLLTMLYDRLVLDLARAEAAQARGDRTEAGAQLLHAQDIVLELRATLRPDGWSGASGLAALYTFLHGELVRANVSGDAAVTAGCRALVEPLREAWHSAALAVAADAAGAGGLAVATG